MFGINKTSLGIFLVCISLMATQVAIAATQGIMSITFDIERIGGIANNQYAVWLEDSSGHYIKTLSVTRFAANGGFNKRPDTLPLWVKVSDWANNVQTDVDAVSTATPGTGIVTLQWDGKDSQGQVVPAGEYIYKIEGNISGPKRILWTGRIIIGQGPNSSIASAEYIPDKETATQKGLFITNIKVSYR